MNNIAAIVNYIKFLTTSQGLSITLHPMLPDTIISSSELIHFNIHNNAYCLYLKSCKDAQSCCIKKQNKILEKCKVGSFTGTCHAGVKEFVYPISDGEKIIGFISVSGYKNEQANQYIKKISQNFNLPINELQKSYSTLKDEIPSKDFVDTLIEPLCNMLELTLLKSKSNENLTLTLSQKIEAYIRKNHNRPIKADDICTEFSCSRSYISTIFKKETGFTIRDYINNLRINDAKILLHYSNLTVTQIAFSVGFSDSNYFTEVFKRYVGMSPLKFKNQK